MTREEAIEKLEKSRRLLLAWKLPVEEFDIAIEALKEPHWIPCSERKPEDTAIVTVETKTFKNKYVCEAVWIPRWSKKAEFDDWEDCSEYNEDEDEYYVLEGWYERVHNWDEYSFVGIEDDVIAWMPLPEPYKADMRGEE